MSDDAASVRHSQAADVDLITDPIERANREAQNGLRQFDVVSDLIDEAVDRERPFKLRPSHLLRLHRVALEGISSYAGNWRPAAIEIGGSRHQPVGAHMVPEEVEALCDYVNDNWASRTAIHLSAYVMWRLNWIHPFTDGNGRTSRALSYFVLCAHMGSRLPGSKTIPDQISENKTLYYKALEEADAAFTDGRIDVSAMEQLLGSLLARQLTDIHRLATGSA